MNSTQLYLVSLTTAVALGCSSCTNNTRITPASENACNVSCGYDYENFRACAARPVVAEYAVKLLQSELYPAVEAILAKEPPGACTCSLAILDESGKFVSATITDTSNAVIGEEIRAAILRLDAIPIPSGAECLVELELPLSFGD